jgi:hypothetical protein
MSGFQGEVKSESVLNANRRFGIESGNKKLVNHRFGRLVVIKFHSFSNQKKGPTQWLCKCDCGNEVVVARNNLVVGNTSSCGCLQKEARHRRGINLEGKRFGRFTVISLSGRSNQGQLKWLCLCDCGKEKRVDGYNLTHGLSTSCGCYRDELVSTHGKCYSLEYSSWVSMISRCTDPNRPFYKHYGGRGITICDRWRESFEAFYKDMGDRPSLDYSIERLDVNGNYEPLNCVWATQSQQMRNVRITKRNTTGVRGVSWSNRRKHYIVQLAVGDKTYYLGSFKLLEDAAKARREAEIKYWGK